MSVAAPKTKRKPATRKKTVPQPTSPWLVVVHNDPVNLMSYVVLVFKKVLGFTEAKAATFLDTVYTPSFTAQP